MYYQCDCVCLNMVHALLIHFEEAIESVGLSAFSSGLQYIIFDLILISVHTGIYIIIIIKGHSLKGVCLLILK